MNAVELRHELHKIPEIALKEFKTTELLISEVEKLEGIKIHRPCETGFLAEYTVNNGEYLLYRADIDALNIKEETGWEYASENGNMHACGHDIHMSVLFGFLKKVAEEKPDQNILFFFQPAEEGAGGAKIFIDTGIFDKFNIKNAFALHVNDFYDEHTVAFNGSVLFASAMEITISFKGIAAHVASPQDGKNTLNAMRTFMDMMERLPKDPVSPVLFGIGRFHTGEVRNIIPASGKIEGSLRSLNMETSQRYFEELIKIGKAIQDSTGVEVLVEKNVFYPEVKNNYHLFHDLYELLEKKFSIIETEYKMTGEDFGFFTRMFPSVMYWLGTGKEKRVGLHNPEFLPSDDVIQTGIDVNWEILNYSISRK